MDYHKLAEPPKCVFVDRTTCNWDDKGLERCKFMRYDNRYRFWYCDSE